MTELQDRLDRTTARIEVLRTEEDEILRRIARIESRRGQLSARRDRLERLASQRADALYRDGGTGMLEVLFSSDDFAELSDRAELMSELSKQDASVFTRLARTDVELRALARELAGKKEEIARTRARLHEESEYLQAQFDDVADEYEDLKAELERARRAARRAEAARGARGSAVAAPQPQAEAPSFSASGGMACPVAGPVSFIDSWGAPRDGHVHQGVDMMAAYGTPVVAIVSGTITYAAYDGSGGNMIFLSGDDGHAYWYMHNQENLVTGGRVSVGQQIATVGDTGNAAGTPHVHFEYHPGGGAAVNPYPLVASIC